MNYIKIKFDSGTIAFQEVFAGNVIRYCDEAGNTITNEGSAILLDADPVAPVWALPDPVPEPQPEPAPVTNIITKLAYMKRFTDTELATIFTAAKTEVMIEVWLEKFKVAEDIDLADPETMAGVQALEAFGLIGAGRAAEILGA